MPPVLLLAYSTFQRKSRKENLMLAELLGVPQGTVFDTPS
jgi:hypothetical protein